MLAKSKVRQDVLKYVVKSKSTSWSPKVRRKVLKYVNSIVKYVEVRHATSRYVQVRQLRKVRQGKYVKPLNRPLKIMNG